jgi:NADPH:quinone reductase-like Zn-dependent oxidoreductase
MSTIEPLPEQMKAWVWSKEARVISLSDQAVPTLAQHDVLIMNKAVGLNPVDWKFIETDLGDRWSHGHIPGVDGAGVVIAVGDASNQHWLGAAVCYHQSLYRSGSFAEYTAIDARTLISLPKQMTWMGAAAFPCPVMTAWQAIEKVPVQQGVDILITGAGGAVGRILVQLARARGFKVTAQASRKRHSELSELGADLCIESTEQLAQPFYAIFDTVSAEHAEQLASGVEANGHLVCIMGRLEKAAVPVFSTAISQHEVALNALHGTGSVVQWQRFTQMAEKLLNQFYQGELKGPDIHVVKFDQLAEALREFKSNRKALKYTIELA